MITLIIQLPSPGHRFGFFYSVAFVAALLLLLYEGYRRKFPMLRWILIVSFSQILFIAGTKLFALSNDEWETMLKTLVLVPTYKKELFGGLLMLGAGLWTGKKWMQFRHGILDPFAIVLPLSLAIQKAGCFFAGCCFGRPCELPWAVQYPVDTLPHYHHYMQSLIGHGELLSLPVHPAQLYEMVGVVLVVCLVTGFRNKWKKPGSSFLFSISLYLLVRFAVEFYKDPLAHTTGGVMIGFLNQTQWGIVFVLPVLCCLLFYRESRHSRSLPLSPKTQDQAPATASVISFLLLSAAIIAILAGWFRTVEIAVILLFFTLAAFLTVRHIFVKYTTAGTRLLYLIFLILPFLLMGQTIPRELSDSVRVIKSKSARIGFASGNFDNTYETFQGEGCDRIGKKGYFNQDYTLAGATMNFRNENLTRRFETNYGLTLTMGNHSERMLKMEEYPTGTSPYQLNPETRKRLYFDINPYIKFDTRWVGTGAGLHAGKLSYSVSDREKEDTKMPVSGRVLTAFYPQFNLRIGPRDIAWLNYSLADHFPSVLPGYRHLIGVGTCFGSDQGISFQFGTRISGPVSHHILFQFSEITFKGIYSTGTLPLGRNYILEPMLYFSQSPFDQKNQLQFSVALRYVWGENSVTLRAPALK